MKRASVFGPARRTLGELVARRFNVPRNVPDCFDEPDVEMAQPITPPAQPTSAIPPHISSPPMVNL